MQTTNLAAMLCRAAVHSAWIVYIAPPSPVKPMTVLSGIGDASRRSRRGSRRRASRRGSGRTARPGRRQIAGQRRRVGQRLVEDHRVRRQLRRQLLHEARRRAAARRRGPSRPPRSRPRVLAARLRSPPRAAPGAAASCLAGDQRRSSARPAPPASAWDRDQPEIDRVVLGDLVGVEVDVDRLGARREDVAQLREHLRQHVGADDRG